MPGGRPRKPTALHVVDGTYREDRHGSDVVVGGSPSRPGWLVGEAALMWDRISGQLASAGVATSLDSASLAGLCQAWANWRNEQEKYEAGDGHIYSVSNAWTTFEKLAGKFGLTPSDRAKLRTGEHKDESEFLDLIGKSG